MRQIVYFSTASARQDAIVIAGILAASRNRNRLDQITGLLVAGGHRYLQVIEGPDNVVGEAYDRIRRDDRHLGVTLLIDRPASGRSFRGWSMAYVDEPRLDEFASFQQMVDHLRQLVRNEKLGEQIDCFARSFAITPLQAWAPDQSGPATSTVDRAH